MYFLNSSKGARSEYFILSATAAIGVVYNAAYEKYENYVPTILTKRYDAFVYIDETHALHPLYMPEVKEDKEELPETFPTGL